jgi:uncharacterized membrane protein YkvI
MNAASFRSYIMPGLVFQGVIIGGGYGTGRELVEYFARYGPIGGVLGMWGVTMVVWAVVLALTFVFARVFRHYDYRSFLIELLGPFWVAIVLLLASLGLARFGIIALVTKGYGSMSRGIFVVYVVPVLTVGVYKILRRGRLAEGAEVVS